MLEARWPRIGLLVLLEVVLAVLLMLPAMVVAVIAAQGSSVQQAVISVNLWCIWTLATMPALWRQPPIRRRRRIGALTAGCVAGALVYLVAREIPAAPGSILPFLGGSVAGFAVSSWAVGVPTPPSLAPPD